jgi:hypothetical protein
VSSPKKHRWPFPAQNRFFQSRHQLCHHLFVTFRMSSFLDLIVAAQPHSADPLRTIVGDYIGGTVEYWRGVYARPLHDLTGQRRESSNHSYFDELVRHHNHWNQYDAVIIQFQQRTQLIVHKHSSDMLNSEQGIRQWRQLMMPLVVFFDCVWCGSKYQKRVALSDDPTYTESECNQCLDMMAVNHEQMLNDYLDTLSPRSREIDESLREMETETCESVSQASSRHSEMPCAASLALPSPIVPYCALSPIGHSSSLLCDIYLHSLNTYCGRARPVRVHSSCSLTSPRHADDVCGTLRAPHA